MKKIFYTLLISVFLVSCGGGTESSIEKCQINEVSTGIEFTWDLDDARQILKTNKKLAFGMDWIIYQEKDGILIKRLRSDASKRIDEAISKYPDVLLRSDIFINAMDEIFWNSDPTTKWMTERQRKEQDLQTGIAAVQLIRQKLPHTQIGVLINPEAWQSDPYALELYLKLVPYLDWASTDVYFWTINPDQIKAKLKAANDFADSVHKVNPKLPLYMAFQGFAPVDWKQDTKLWTVEQKKTFGKAIEQLFLITKQKYYGAIIWAWNGWPDLPGFVFGYQFPADLKQYYIDGLRTICNRN